MLMTKLKQSLEIKVSHKIGDIVNHSFNDATYRVIWYNYIKTRWVQYICQQSENDDYVYLYDIDIKKWSDFIIWFK